jgi:hypothetical protein
MLWYVYAYRTQVGTAFLRVLRLFIFFLAFSLSLSPFLSISVYSFPLYFTVI